MQRKFTKEASIFTLFRSVLVLLFMIATFDSMAGVVRSIRTDDKKMNSIYLRMGQSTVLRFKDDRPKKIVVGNQNYYNIEFVEGTKDVTLQPLGTVKTNLFVYCQKNTYGFLLATSSYGKYDDLVNVFWKAPKRRYKGSCRLTVGCTVSQLN